MALSDAERAKLGLPPRGATGPASGLPAARTRRTVSGTAPIAVRPRGDDGNTNRGLFRQLSDTFTNIIPGVAGLVGQAAISAAAPVRAVVDYAQGDLSGTDALFAGSGIDQIGALVGNDASQARAAEYNPLGYGMGESVKDTIGRVRHPTQYARAVRQGRIVDTILEDAGNVALAGGIASKALGGASATARAAGNVGRADRFANAARITNRVARPLDAVADSPIRAGVSVPRFVGRKARTGLIGGYDAAAAGRLGPRFQSAAKTLGRRAPTLTSDIGRYLKSETRALGRSATRARTAPSRKLFNDAMANDLTVAEQGAILAVRTGLADEFSRYIDEGMEFEDARRLIASRDIPEQTFTADVAQAALDYTNGSLSVADQTRFDAGVKAVGEVLGENTDRALQGVGRPGGPMDPAYIGSEPLWDQVERAVKDEGYETMAAAPRDVLDAILDNPEMYPAAWRPRMLSAARARSSGLDVPLRPGDIIDEGGSVAEYVPGGPSELADPTRQGTGRRPDREGLRGITALSSEKHRVTSEVQPYSFRTLGEKAGDEAYKTTMNEGIDRIFNDGRLPTVGEVIPEVRRTQLRNEAAADAQVRGGTKRQIAATANQLYGDRINAELADVHGMEIIGGERGTMNVHDWDPNKPTFFGEVNDGSVVLPAGLKERLVPYMRPKDMGKFMQALAKINTKFKGAVLPFSVRWQLGDLTGGAFMSWVGGGIPPWELVRGMRKAKSLDDTGRAAIVDNPNYQEASLSIDEQSWQKGTADQAAPKTGIGRAWRKAGGIRRNSFRLNAAINRTNRQGFVLAKLQKLLDERGLNLDDVQATGGWDAPEVQDAITVAVDEANRVMGTFDEMTPFERNYVRNLFPFWAWNRHITQLAWRTAIDNPSRMMWTMRIGSYGSDPAAPELQLPWLRGSIAVGDSLIPTNFINPFNDVGGGSIYTLTGALRAMSPGIKLGLAAVGKDANRGLADITRPYDGRGLDELNRPGGFRLMNPTEFAYTALRQIPQGRVAMNLAPTGQAFGVGLGPHPRYGSGEFMVDKRGDPIDTTSRWQSVAALFGLGGGTGDVPLVSNREDLKPIVAARDRRGREARRRAENTVRYDG